LHLGALGAGALVNRVVLAPKLAAANATCHNDTYAATPPPVVEPPTFDDDAPDAVNFSQSLVSNTHARKYTGGGLTAQERHAPSAKHVVSFALTLSTVFLFLSRQAAAQVMEAYVAAASLLLLAAALACSCCASSGRRREAADDLRARGASQACVWRGGGGAGGNR